MRPFQNENYHGGTPLYKKPYQVDPFYVIVITNSYHDCFADCFADRVDDGDC